LGSGDEKGSAGHEAVGHVPLKTIMGEKVVGGKLRYSSIERGKSRKKGGVVRRTCSVKSRVRNAVKKPCSSRETATEKGGGKGIAASSVVRGKKSRTEEGLPQFPSEGKLERGRTIWTGGEKGVKK